MKRFLTLVMLMVFIMVSSALRANATMATDTVAAVYAQINGQNVEVVWSWDQMTPVANVIDFETGDFSQANFTNDADFPWEITQDAYEGTYAAKSTNAGVSGTEPFLELTVEVPYDNAVLSFYHRVESEWGYDGGIFYLDGQSRASISGIVDEWQYVEVTVPKGVHTYSWGYFKDSSDEGEIGSDSYYVDNIVAFAPGAEVEEGWLHYDDGYFSNAIGMGSAGADNYWAVSFPDMLAYTGQTLTKVAVYAYQGTNMTATVCLGGTNAPGTAMATQTFAVTPGEVTEVELDTPVAIDGTQPLWIVMYNNDAEYPAASSAFCGDANSSWFMMNGGWYDVASLGVSPMTWMIRGYVEDAEGRTVAMSQGEFAPISNVTSDAKIMTFTPERKRIVGTPAAEPTREIYQYNVYRKSILAPKPELIAENLTDTVYFDETWSDANPGAYSWGVEVVDNSRKADRGSLLNVDFENGAMPEGWITSSTNSFPNSPSKWKVSTALESSNDLLAKGLYGAFSMGTAYDAYQYQMITSAIDLTAADSPVLSFEYANPDWDGDICMLNVYVGTSQEGPWTSVWTTAETSAATWTPATIDLSEFVGEKVYLNFENVDTYGYGVGVDNIVITSYEPAVVWSNMIEKDMFTTVDITAGTNTDESVKGTEVTFVNISEPGKGYDYSVKLDETGMYAWTEFRRGTYEYTVYKKGYQSCATKEVVEIIEPESFTCYLTEAINDVENLYVSPTGLAIWEGDDVIASGDEFKFDFEDGTMEGWTTYDVDGDGYTWKHMWDFWGEEIGYNSKGSITSASYTNELGPLTPDNYIVTNEKYLIGGASQLTFMLAPMNPNYPSEHYGIGISTTGNNPEDFTMVWEETFMQGRNVTKDADAVRGQKRAEYDWYMRTVDLSAYAGQKVYIALRHFNVTDMYIFAIDDIALTNAAKASRVIKNYTVSLNEAEEAVVTDRFYQHENVTPGETYTTTVVAHYASGDSEPMSYTWTCAACDEFDGVSNLETKCTDDGYALLTWTLPESKLTSDWLQYDDDEIYNVIGMQGGGNFFWANMFPAEELTVGTLTKVSMYDHDVAFTGDIYIALGGDEAPETIVTTQAFECTAAGAFVEFELLEPVTIDGTQNLWIIFSNNDGSEYIATTDDNGTSVNSAWISLDGASWMDGAEVLGYPVAWMVRGHIQGGTEPLGVIIYRDGELLTEEIVTDEVYGEPLIEEGVYEYCIQVVHSNYAIACSQCEELVYYVSVDENNANTMSVYPNPVKDNLTIVAENMTRVTITNTLGQVMLDEAVVSNNEVINVTQYEAGVYVVRITTETGIVTERITVIK